MLPDHTQCSPTRHTSDASAGTCNQGSVIVSCALDLTVLTLSARATPISAPLETHATKSLMVCVLLLVGMVADSMQACVAAAPSQGHMLPDHTHCSPTRHTSAASAGTCSQGSMSVSLVTKIRWIPLTHVQFCGCLRNSWIWVVREFHIIARLPFEALT
jgi:hypothetical protein